MNQIVITLPAWFTVQEVNFLIGGFVGLVANFCNMKARGRVKGSLYRYLFIDTPGWTASTVLMLIAACAAAEAVGGLSGMKLEAVVAAGFTSGFAIDNVCQALGPQQPPPLPGP